MGKIVKLNQRRKAKRVARPGRDEAEAAVRTLIRWAGDDPGREGLRGTPGRVARAYRGMVLGLFRGPARLSEAHLRGGRGLRRDRAAARRPVCLALRAPHGADHRAGAHRLSAAQPRRRHLQAGPPGRRVRPAPAGAGEDDGAKSPPALTACLKPHGVAVVVEGVHECMTTRGVRRPDVSMVTSRDARRVPRTGRRRREEFLAAINMRGAVTGAGG